MGVYSTLSITRSKAKQAIIDRLEDGVTDLELEGFMDEYLEPRFYNCIVIDDNNPVNDDYMV